MQHFLTIQVYCYHSDFDPVVYHLSSDYSIDDALDTTKLLYHEEYGVIPDKITLQFNHSYIWKKSKKFLHG